MSDLVETPEDRFSHNEAHLIDDDWISGYYENFSVLTR